MSDIIPNVVVSMPSQQFTLARKFQAASNGKIYIGKIDTDPTIPSNQIQVYLENEDGSTIPVAQPLIINQAGFPVYNGQIAKFVTVEGHSMAVYDSYGAQQFYYPNVLKYDPDQFDKRFREELKSSSGASLIGTSSGLTVQQSINRRYWYAEDFLPMGYASDGSISYTSEIQTAVSMSAAAGVILIMPNFEVLIDPNGTTFGGINVPDNAHIVFNKNSKLKIKPNSLTNYELISIRDKSNIIIEGGHFIGDKFEHAGTAGEWGMCISIRGSCENITIKNPKIDDAWGDGIYIGQISNDKLSTPKNTKIINPIINRCRRQGISITSADGLLIDNPIINETRSTDSAAEIPAGPHAGIDIEPNSFNSLLNNIVINNLSGGNNDAGLLYLYLGGIDNNNTGEPYFIDIKVNGISDTGSREAITLAGNVVNADCRGAIYINNVSSTRPMRNGIRGRLWTPKIPVFIDGCSIIDWHNDKSANAAIDTCAITMYNNSNSTFPDLGGLFIKNLSLINKKSPADISERAVYITNQSGAGVKDMSIDIAKVEINKDVTYIQSGAGPIYLSQPEFGKSFLQRRSASWTQVISLSNDILIDKPSVQITMRLPEISGENDKLAGYSVRAKMIQGDYGNFRIRKSDVPLYCNGIEGANFLVMPSSGVVNIEFDGIAFYITSKGPVIKES
ncbi:phage tailspike protein [Providencia rettgeri]|uniref:phage tailspike protein n=1 Tax=Providencia rettgeri TaxID=587 RepID=UPI003525055B